MVDRGHGRFPYLQGRASRRVTKPTAPTAKTPTTISAVVPPPITVAAGTAPPLPRWGVAGCGAGAGLSGWRAPLPLPCCGWALPPGGPGGVAGETGSVAPRCAGEATLPRFPPAPPPLGGCGPPGPPPARSLARFWAGGWTPGWWEEGGVCGSLYCSAERITCSPAPGPPYPLSSGASADPAACAVAAAARHKRAEAPTSKPIPNPHPCLLGTPILFLAPAPVLKWGCLHAFLRLQRRPRRPPVSLSVKERL